MGREHFTVSVDVHALVFGLLKEKFHIVQVMTAHDDKRPFFNGQWNFCRDRVAVCVSVCSVEKCHTFQVHIACFKHQPQQLFRVVLTAYGTQSLVEKACHLAVSFAKCLCVISIRRHTLYSEEDK